MRAIALSTRYIARASAAATSRAASSEATLDRSSLQTVNGLEELWETMEEGGHSVYFSDRVTRKLAAMEKDQAEWVGEAEDEIARLLEIPPEFVGRARLRYGYTDLQEAKPSWDYEHPVNWKVTLSVKIAALDLAEAARDDLIAMLGPVRLRARSRRSAQREVRRDPRLCCSTHCSRIARTHQPTPAHLLSSILSPLLPLVHVCSASSLPHAAALRHAVRHMPHRGAQVPLARLQPHPRASHARRAARFRRGSERCDGGGEQGNGCA